MHPTLPLVYVLHELSSTVNVHHLDTWNVHFGLSPEPVQSISTRPILRPANCDGPPLPNQMQNLAAEIRVSLCGRWVLCSNRGDNNITIFPLDKDGRVILVKEDMEMIRHRDHYIDCGGDTPRHFTLISGPVAAPKCQGEASGLVIVANQNSSSILSFRWVQKRKNDAKNDDSDDSNDYVLEPTGYTLSNVPTPVCLCPLRSS
jgi:6-phosphogluconolactonase